MNELTHSKSQNEVEHFGATHLQESWLRVDDNAIHLDAYVFR